ncbi:MAG: TMEM165/GDT1 family protein [Myxococcales bacterium]
MLAAVAAALGLIFVAELGDKTLLTVLLLSTRNRPLPIFLGACAAFLLHTGIAVAFGQILAFVPPSLVRWATAALFALFGALLLLRGPEAEGEAAGASGRPFATAFAFIFLAEWGDMTQILTATLVARDRAALGRLAASAAVFAGATLGLWLGTAVAVLLGRTVGRRLPARGVRVVAGLCFLAFAALTAAGKAV